MTERQYESVLAALQRIEATQAEILARLAPPSILTNETHRRLLAEIHRASAGMRFSVADLIMNSEVTKFGAGDIDLHDAICGAGIPLNVKCLGNLLAQLEGKTIDSFVVRRGKRNSAGVQWRVESEKCISNQPNTL